MFNTISIGLVAVAFVVIRRWKVEKEFTLWEDAHAIYIIVLSGLMLLAMGTVMMKFNAILTSVSPSPHPEENQAHQPAPN